MIYKYDLKLAIVLNEKKKFNNNIICLYNNSARTPYLSVLFEHMFFSVNICRAPPTSYLYRLCRLNTKEHNNCRPSPDEIHPANKLPYNTIAKFVKTLFFQ